MATWWGTGAIPLAATALVPVVAFPAFGVLGVGDTTENYGDDIVFLFLGGFLIAIAMQKWNLHRRVVPADAARWGRPPAASCWG